MLQTERTCFPGCTNCRRLCLTCRFVSAEDGLGISTAYLAAMVESVRKVAGWAMLVAPISCLVGLVYKHSAFLERLELEA
jgi:hypothetical protein